jgi:hypothetical protein
MARPACALMIGTALNQCQYGTQDGGSPGNAPTSISGNKVDSILDIAQTPAPEQHSFPPASISAPAIAATSAAFRPCGWPTYRLPTSVRVPTRPSKVVTLMARVAERAPRRLRENPPSTPIPLAFKLRLRAENMCDLLTSKVSKLEICLSSAHFRAREYCCIGAQAPSARRCGHRGGAQA